MKKMILSLLAVSGFALAAHATLSAVSDLNQIAVEVLQPYQNDNTQANLEFVTVNANDQHVLQGQAHAFFQKVGTKNTLSLKLDDVNYAYNNGQTPSAQIKGALGIDLSKLFPQEDLNNLASDLDGTVKALADDYIKDYGAAVTLNTETKELNKDAAGNVVSAKAVVTLSFDYSKLPANQKAEDIVIKSALIDLGLNVKTGLTFSGTVQSNPAYKGFKAGEIGLKESLDLMLKRDPAALQKVKDFFNKLNELADGMIN